LEYGLPKDYYSTYASRISAFTPDELQIVGQKVYSPNDLSVIVVGDASQVKSKLERFGKVDVYDLDLKPVKFTEEKLRDAKMTLDQVLEFMYKSINKPALEKITNREIDGERSIGITGEVRKGAMTVIEAAPNKKYEKFELGSGVTIEARNDGNHVINYYPGGNGVPSPDEKIELANSVFNEELHLRDPNNSVKLLGLGDSPGGESYVLDVMKNGASHEKWYISTQTGYLVRREEIRGEESATTDYSDFRMVDGIPYAFHEETHGAGDQSFQVSSIKHNVQVDEKLFMKK
ncbi:MAG: hypothetical protein Q8916_14670, partial [Bacteroidota bacterium]|nr:hypothetical protein [Bacteroidota bacterium]